MNRLLAIISGATTVLAFYNEARRAGLIEDLVAKWLPYSHNNNLEDECNNRL